MSIKDVNDIGKDYSFIGRKPASAGDKCRTMTVHPISEDGANGVKWEGGFTECGRTANFFSKVAGEYVCRSHFKHAEGRWPVDGIIPVG